MLFVIKMVIFQLFIVFLKIGLFAIGGAYSFLPLLERDLVERYSWLIKDEFLDVLGLVKIFPGAISIKFATYTGYKIAGIPGAIAANIGNFLAPAIIVLFASTFYRRYKDMPRVEGAFDMIQLVVFAMIIAVSFKLIDLKQLLQFRELAVVIAAFCLFAFTKIHPAFIIIGAGVLGAVVK